MESTSTMQLQKAATRGINVNAMTSQDSLIGSETTDPLHNIGIDYSSGYGNSRTTRYADYQTVQAVEERKKFMASLA